MRKGFQISDEDLIEKAHVSHQSYKLDTLLLDRNPQVQVKIYDTNIVTDWDMKTLNVDKNNQRDIHQ